jgi:hypothetical protein
MSREEERTSAEWSRLVSEQRSSGETQKVWRSERGISLRTFRDWARKLKRKEAAVAVEWYHRLTSKCFRWADKVNATFARLNR